MIDKQDEKIVQSVIMLSIQHSIPLAHKKKKSIQFTRVMYFAIKYLSNLRHYVTFPPLYLN